MAKLLNKKIAYQGETGANSYVACIEMFPDLKPLACATFEDAALAVKSGDAHCAMIPIENTLAGRVADVHLLLPNANLQIIGELFFAVHLHLMAPYGTSLDKISDIYSHVHALGQCRQVIRRLKATAHISGDTAGAARQVAEWNDLSKAALAPEIAADIYGLNILERSVEDKNYNVTRFIILAMNSDDSSPDGKPYITTFIFRIRNVPSALYKALGGFASNGVNMTKLESYQVGRSFNATMFYVDIEGHPSDYNVKLALKDLSSSTVEFKMLGTYKACPKRTIISNSSELCK
ncbi:MAG: prephenate dehydratase [Hyphomicrobiaceae bacterium]|nr:prephenate dehydratase [Hyphomicrobiaceae bacterium]